MADIEYAALRSDDRVFFEGSSGIAAACSNHQIRQISLSAMWASFRGLSACGGYCSIHRRHEAPNGVLLTELAELLGSDEVAGSGQQQRQSSSAGWRRSLSRPDRAE